VSLGWTEGKNLVIEQRFYGGDLATLQRQVRELVEAKVDLLVCPSEIEAEVCREITTSTPIVSGVLVNPIDRGLISSFAHPGRNVTGLTWEPSPEFAEKYPELLREILPDLALVGDLFESPFSALETYRSAFVRGARRLGIDIFHAEYRDEGDLDVALRALVTRGVQAVFTYGSRTSSNPVHMIKLVRFFAAHRLPDMWANHEAVERGGLISYGVDFTDLTRRSANYVDKILRGAKPADLPVERPIKIEMAINLKTAKTLGLKVPQSLLVRADQLIE
jgi:putative ABC transport system substrate-binding protein